MSDAIRRKYVCCQEEKEVVSACDGNCLDWILGCETCFLQDMVRCLLRCVVERFNTRVHGARVRLTHFGEDYRWFTPIRSVRGECVWKVDRLRYIWNFITESGRQE